MTDARYLIHFLVFKLDTRERNYLLWVLISISAIAIIPSISPVILAHITDTITANKNLGNDSISGIIVALVLIYIMSILIGRVVSILSSYLLSMFRLGAIKTLCEMFFSYLNKQSEVFFVENNSGSLVHRLNQSNNDIFILTRVVALGIISPLIQLLTTFAVLLYGKYYVVSSLFVIYAIIFISANIVVTKKLVAMRSSLMNAGRVTYSILDDSINNFHLAKYFSASGYLLARYQNTLETDRSVQKDYWRMSILLSSFNAAIFLVFISGAIVWTTVNALSGSISIGSFVMITSYTLMLTAPMESLGNAFTESNQSISTFLSFIKSISASENSNELSIDANQSDCGYVGFDMKDVCFKYPQQTDYALSGVSISMRPGEKIAITGSSGSGKTTFIKIMCLICQPTSGNVNWYWSDARKRQDLWSKTIGLISQETYILQDTIRFNLAIANPSASDDELVEAVRLAGLYEYFLSLPSGLDTVLGNRGAKLSGGQRQRIALARLFLRKPDVLIIDEGTSAIDAVTEELILDNIFSVFSEKTIILSSHRANVLKRAESIIIFSEGRIADAGSWEDMKDNGYLKKIIDISNIS